MGKWNIIRNSNDKFLHAILPLSSGMAVIRNINGKFIVEFRTDIVGVDNVTFNISSDNIDNAIKEAEIKLQEHFKVLNKYFYELFNYISND